MKRKVQFVLLFACGFVLGALLYGRQNRSSAAPIRTSYCFFAQNKDIFVDRQIVTSAQIWVLVHGMSLSDPSCPDGALAFTASRDVGGKVGDLDAKLRTVALFGKLPVTFIGTLRSPSRIKNLYRWARYYLGLSIRPEPELVIDQVVSVGEVTD